MKLSILDQSVSVKGKSQDQTITDTLKLSVIAENLDFTDFGFQNIIIILQLLELHLKF